MAVSTILNNKWSDLGQSVKNLDTLLGVTGSGYTNNATGIPSGAGNGTVLVFKSGTVTTQIYLPYNGAQRPQFRQYAGSWTAWHTLY